MKQSLKLPEIKVKSKFQIGDYVWGRCCQRFVKILDANLSQYQSYYVQYCDIISLDSKNRKEWVSENELEAITLLQLLTIRSRFDEFIKDFAKSNSQ